MGTGPAAQILSRRSFGKRVAAGSIDGLYPASGAAAAANGGQSTGGPVVSSALLTAATFTAAFDILPGASPFVLQAMSAAGNATITINPAQNTWQATYVVPTAAARAGDFSGDGFVITNFLSGACRYASREVMFWACTTDSHSIR
jgi:hypothetical protein